MRLCLSCLLVALGWVASAAGLHSPEAYATADANRHLFVARGPASVPWSKGLVDDFALLQYERSRNTVVGYQKSTGKVFAQKQAHALGVSVRPVEIDSAMILGLPLQKGLRSSDDPGGRESALFGLSRSRECPALTLMPHIKVGELQWRNPEQTSFGVDRLHTWHVSSVASKGKRLVKITSNHNSVYACTCRWVDTRSVWRSVDGVSRSLGCVAQEFVGRDTAHNPDGVDTIPRAQLARENLNRRQFCQEMTASLAFRVLVAVDVHALDAAVWQSLNSEDKCWLRAVAASVERGQTTRAEAVGWDTVRAPRAVVLLDIKTALKSAELVQTLIGTLTADVQLLLTKTVQLMGGRWLANTTAQLYAGPHTGRIGKGTISDELEALHAKETSLIPLEIPLLCDARAQPHLLQMLSTPNVALTPESANTSAVSVQFGLYVQELAACQSAQAQVLLEFGQCFRAVNADMATALGGRTSLPSASGESLAGLLQSGVPSSVAAGLKKLHHVQSAKYKRLALQSRQQMIDVADTVVARGVDVVDAQVGQTQVLMQEYASAFASWDKRLRALNQAPGATPRRTPRDEAPWFQLFADIWCCAVASPGSLLKVSIPCKGYLERKIQAFAS